MSDPLVAALQRHRMPEFLEEDTDKAVYVPEPLSAFRRCRNALGRHVVATLPTTSMRLRRFSEGAICFGAGLTDLLAPQSMVGHMIGHMVGNGLPMLFAMTAGYLTQNASEGCLTSRGKTKCNVVSSSLIAMGLWSLVGKDIVGDARAMINAKEGLQFFTHLDIEDTVGTLMAGGIAWGLSRNALTVGRRIFRKPVAHRAHPSNSKSTPA